MGSSLCIYHLPTLGLTLCLHTQFLTLSLYFYLFLPLLAYDLLDTDTNKFNVTIWYNSTSKTKLLDRRVKLVRVPRSVNLVRNQSLLCKTSSSFLLILYTYDKSLDQTQLLQISNAYLQYLKGPGTKLLFEFVKEMPKVETWLHVDIASSIGPIFFTWVILLLFPVSSF